MVDFKESLTDLNEKISSFFAFIGNKIMNFKNLSLGEQIGFCSVGAGLLLIIVSVVLFLV